MGGPGDPPEGTPEGGPGGAEDEYRSVVFDESFVRAARLQEYSAEERMADHAPAVRRRPPHRRLVRQAMILVLLMAVAFGTAVYMGVRHPYDSAAAPRPVEPLRMTVVPLAPRGRVPGGTDAETLYAHSPAARFDIGAEGVPLPAARGTAHFSDSDVMTALTTAKDYIVRSSLYPEVLTGHETAPARALVDSGQLAQFDRSFDRPAADGRHAPTGWVVRLDPARDRLADDRIRVQGDLRFMEEDPVTLEVSADHTFVYALRPTGGASGHVSLFTVRRVLTFRFTRDDLRTRQVQLTTAYVEAGPLSCAGDSTSHLHPLLAGQAPRPGTPAGTDPYETDSPASLCGTLAKGSEPQV
ncbi:hypothetical protein [Streptomyces malaysiense]|uniref:Uncharacterized protein n=1 Tax=Streptomyces malaysiense TaxID=1428626 RepID=A0A1J4Q2C4_9ACTN|nr:hypothetical protein [Streptomyces malaysiense]OIK27299.1 hypothetical protein VT52_012095 [Streptomyces malaysiense]